jgi:hypothetical protein
VGTVITGRYLRCRVFQGLRVVEGSRSSDYLCRRLQQGEFVYDTAHGDVVAHRGEEPRLTSAEHVALQKRVRPIAGSDA